jgi:hypothetical protein
VVTSFPLVQGGSNMIGTDCMILHTNQSRSYLNHLVLTYTTYKQILNPPVLCD